MKSYAPYSFKTNPAQQQADTRRWGDLLAVRSAARPAAPRGLRATPLALKVQLAWDPAADRLTGGWRLYQDTESGLIQIIKDVSTLAAEVRLTDTLVHNFFLSAVSASGSESRKVVTQVAALAIGLDDVADGTTYKRVANVNGAHQLGLDYVIDGATYRRLLYVGADNQLSSSTTLNKQGSIPGLSDIPFSYTSSTNSITWTWSAFTLYFTDGSTLAVPGGSSVFSGLNASTTYYFCAYVTVATGLCTVVKSNCGVPAGSCPAGNPLIMGVCNHDGNVAVNINFTGATTASGTGGGSPGGGGVSCFSPNTRVRTWRGCRPIATVEAGDRVQTARGTWRRVLAVTSRPYRGKALNMGRDELVTPEHLFLQREWMPVGSLNLYPGRDYEGTIHNLHVETEADDDGLASDTEHSYRLSNGWTVHNVLT